MSSENDTTLYDRNSDDEDEEDINNFWGDIPANIFARDKRCGGDDDDNAAETIDPRSPAAEHLLVLLDCSPGMFVPSVPVQSKEHVGGDFTNAPASGDDNDKSDDDDSTVAGEESKLIAPVQAVMNSLEDYVRLSVREIHSRKAGKSDGFGLTLFSTRRRERLDIGRLLEQQARHWESADKQIKKKDDDADSDDSSGVDDDRRSEKVSSSESVWSRTVTDIHHLIPLNVPGTDTIRTLLACLRSLDDYDDSSGALDLEREFGYLKKLGDDEPPLPLPDAVKSVLMDCLTTFREANCVKKPGSRKADDPMRDHVTRVWIFTNQDGVKGGQLTVKKKRALQEIVSDLKNGANCENIKVWPLPNALSKRPFSLDKGFFNDVEIEVEALDTTARGYCLDLKREGNRKSVRRFQFGVALLLPDDIPSEDEETSMNGNSQLHSQSQSHTRTSGPQQEGNEDDNDKPKRAPRIMLELYAPSLRRCAPSAVRVLKKITPGQRQVELERVSYVMDDRGNRLASFSSISRTKADQETEKQDAEAKTGWLRRCFQTKKRDYIPLTRDEVSQLKRKSNVYSGFASLVLLGFKKRGTVPLHFNMKSYFAYPCDTVVGGSTVAFAHMHQSMINKNVEGIGGLLLRKGSTSKLVAIHAVPAEPKDGDDDDKDDGTSNNEESKADNTNGKPMAQQFHPPGWIVTLLPFENEMREMIPDESFRDGFEVPGEAQDTADALVNQAVVTGFDLAVNRLLTNGYVEKFWDYIEAEAVPELRMEKVDYKLPTKRADVESLKSAFPEDEKTEKKRSRAALKVDDNMDWKAAYMNDSLGSYKVDDLKKGLKKYGKKISGKKARDRG